MHLTTKGNLLLDADGNPFQIKGINWFGFETSNLAPHGIWQRNYKEMVKQIKDLGFNTVRLPFCNDIFLNNSVSTGIDFNLNRNLENLAPLAIMKEIIEECLHHNLRVILDRHRPSAESQSAFWYTDEVTEMQWLSDWALLASLFKHYDNVIGADLHNEPHDECTWEMWAEAATKCGNIIHAVAPEWLIIVEGVQYYHGSSTWWGGNLKGVQDRPITLNLQNKLVYSAHDYPASIYPQPWFSHIDYPENLPEVWDEFWGYIAKEKIAPVFIGEFGSKLKTEEDVLWLENLLQYMADGDIHFAFWCLNPNSGDTGGILMNDWVTVDQKKMEILGRYL